MKLLLNASLRKALAAGLLDLGYRESKYNDDNLPSLDKAVSEKAWPGKISEGDKENPSANTANGIVLE
jgi:hypothetical protein